MTRAQEASNALYTTAAERAQMYRNQLTVNEWKSDHGICQWFWKCDREATRTTPHPILGNVPTCDKCHTFATK